MHFIFGLNAFSRNSILFASAAAQLDSRNNHKVMRIVNRLLIFIYCRNSQSSVLFFFLFFLSSRNEFSIRSQNDFFWYFIFCFLVDFLRSNNSWSSMYRNSTGLVMILFSILMIKSMFNLHASDTSCLQFFSLSVFGSRELGIHCD